MKFLKITLLLALFSLLISFTVHKFYVSITKIEYVEESESLQIISQIFTDDIEDVLQARYSPDISIGTKKETPADAAFLKEYILQKFKIKVNGAEVKMDYLGREYETDMVKVFIEVHNIDEFKTIEIENKFLFGLFSEQQNIIHVKTSKNRRSLILERDNPKGVLNFN